MIDERKMRAIELHVKGTSNIEIAKILSVSRTSIYNWLEMEEVKVEVARCEREIKTHGNAYITSRTTDYLERMDTLAKNTSDKRTAAQCLMYLLDRSLGKVSTKIDINDGSEGKDIVPVDVLNKYAKDVDKGE